MSFLSCAWLWMYLAAFLFLLELLAPGFVIFFIGLSAATVGLLRFAMGASLPLAGQLAAFSVFTVLYLVFLRRWLKPLFSGKVIAQSNGFDSGLVGRCGRITEAVCPPHSGRVLVGDAEWTAVSNVPLASGTDVKVIAQNNLTLDVEALVPEA